MERTMLMTDGCSRRTVSGVGAMVATGGRWAWGNSARAGRTRTKKIANGAIPLFAKNPETFNPAWEIRCIQFYGTRVVKPIPSLHTYHGTVFELVDQAVDFAMSRVDFAVGAHDGENAAAPTRSEFPRDAIREAIVNAVCHRDYTSNACVQVMLFRDRLEIINPGPKCCRGSGYSSFGGI